MSKTILPSQTGAAGKFLKSDGTDATWQDSGVATHNTSETAHGDIRSQLNEKANKAQEDWITPTFLNGASGSLQYRKNNFGVVEFRGSITITTVGVDHFVLPAGYRATYTCNIPLYSSGGNITYGRFYAAGGVRFYFAGEIYLNHVSYVTI